MYIYIFLYRIFPSRNITRHSCDFNKCRQCQFGDTQHNLEEQCWEIQMFMGSDWPCQLIQTLLHWPRSIRPFLLLSPGIKSTQRHTWYIYIYIYIILYSFGISKILEKAFPMLSQSFPREFCWYSSLIQCAIFFKSSLIPYQQQNSGQE